MITGAYEKESLEGANERLRESLLDMSKKHVLEINAMNKMLNQLRADALIHDERKVKLEDSQRQLNSMTAERGKWLRKLKRAGVKV